MPSPSSTARRAMSRAEDYPIGMPPEAYARSLEAVIAEYGTGRVFGPLSAPALDADRLGLEWRGRLERQARARPRPERSTRRSSRPTCGPCSATACRRCVLHRAGDRHIRGPARPLHRRRTGRWTPPSIASPAPTAPSPRPFDCRLDEPGQEFVTGAPSRWTPRAGSSPRPFSSTSSSPPRLAPELVNARWNDRLDVAMVRPRHRPPAAPVPVNVGIKQTGDGVLAMFDGPGRAHPPRRSPSGRTARRLGLDSRPPDSTRERSRSGPTTSAASLSTLPRG